MPEETKKCKHCQTDIPKKAKVCPNCRRKQGGALKWVIIAFLGIGFIGAMGSSDEETKTTEQVASNTNPVKVEEVRQEQPKTEKVEQLEVFESENVKTETTEIAETKTVQESETVEETIVIPQETEEEYKASCQEYKYKDVLRNPDNYVGQRIKITVKISTVHEESWLNDGKYYFAYSNDEYNWWAGDMYGIFDRRDVQDPKLLEDDIITVYGEISDPEQTTSLIVSSSEVFCIDMKYIDFISE